QLLRLKIVQKRVQRPLAECQYLLTTLSKRMNYFVPIHRAFCDKRHHDHRCDSTHQFTLKMIYTQGNSPSRLSYTTRNIVCQVTHKRNYVNDCYTVICTV